MSAPCQHIQPPQSGAAAIETTLSLLLMLLVATAIIEFSYWGVVRQLCQLALHESLRLAVSQNGTQHSLDQAFSRVRHSRLSQPWSLRIVHPDTDSLGDFQEPFLSAQQGHPVIRNDSQREQHRRLLLRWPEGRGPASRKTIFEANVLMVELTYQHRLLSPWLHHLIGSADTRLKLQAAMQSDFHASRERKSNWTHPVLFDSRDRPSHANRLSHKWLQRSGQIDRTPRPTSENPTLPMLRDKHQQQLMAQQRKYESLTPSDMNRTDIALHPDLAEQCRSFMCCVNP